MAVLFAHSDANGGASLGSEPARTTEGHAAEEGQGALARVPGLERHIREYRNGRDLMSTPRDALVIDLFGLSVDEVRERFPAVFQWLLERVRAAVKPLGAGGINGAAAAVERIKAGGGQVLNGPMEVPGGGWVLNAVDPQGALFSLLSGTA